MWSVVLRQYRESKRIKERKRNKTGLNYLALRNEELHKYTEVNERETQKKNDFKKKIDFQL